MVKVEFKPRAQYNVMPWKNGGGITEEVFINPPSAKFPTDPFAWRMSSALVRSSGPFSKFPEYSRYLFLVRRKWELEGGSLHVTSKDEQNVCVDRHLRHAGDMMELSGKNDTSATIAEGDEIRDLNFFFDRRSISYASWQTMLIVPGEVIRVSAANPASTHLILFSCAGAPISAQVIGQQRPVQMNTFDTLLLVRDSGESDVLACDFSMDAGTVSSSEEDTNIVIGVEFRQESL
jgi:environmental stress-induced protein Ves